VSCSRKHSALFPWCHCEWLGAVPAASQVERWAISWASDWKTYLVVHYYNISWFRCTSQYAYSVFNVVFPVLDQVLLTLFSFPPLIWGLLAMLVKSHSCRMYQKWVLKARIGLFVENVLIKLLFSDIFYRKSTLPTLFWVQLCMVAGFSSGPRYCHLL
jgi:hypothetical protein